MSGGAQASSGGGAGPSAEAAEAFFPALLAGAASSVPLPLPLILFFCMKSLSRVVRSSKNGVMGTLMLLISRALGMESLAKLVSSLTPMECEATEACIASHTEKMRYPTAEKLLTKKRVTNH